VGGGASSLQLQQFADQQKQLDQKRTQDAQAMAKEQARLESLAIGFGLKPGEAKSMSSLELDRFVNTQMTYQVKQKEMQSQNLELNKFLADQKKLQSDINYRNRALDQNDRRLDQNDFGQTINMMNARTNLTNAQSAKSQREGQEQANLGLSNAILRMANKDKNFATKNSLLVQMAKEGAPVSSIQSMLPTPGSGMTEYQKENLKLKKDAIQRDKDDRTLEGNITLPMFSEDGSSSNSPVINYKGKLSSKSDVTKFRVGMTNTQKALNTLSKLIEIGDEVQKKYGSFTDRMIAKINIIDPKFHELQNQAETLRRQMIGVSRVQLLGPGVLSNYDVSVIEAIFQNPADLFQLYPKVNELRRIRNNMINGVQVELKNYGLEYSSPSQKSEGEPSAGAENPTGKLNLGGQEFYTSPGNGIQVTSP